MANGLNPYWQEHHQAVLGEYKAARDDLARDLARYSGSRPPCEGVVAAGLFVICGVVGSISTDDEEGYAEDAVAAILDGYSDLARLARHVSAEVYFRELIDELFDAKVASLRKSLDPGYYAPTHHADVAALLEKYPLSKGVTP